MKPTVTYEDAVFSMVVAVKGKVIDTFTASTILAIMFDMEKEDTLDSIMNMFFVTARNYFYNLILAYRFIEGNTEYLMFSP